MAYDAFDIAVTLTGTLAGSESWSNSFAFKSSEVAPDVQDAVDLLHGFYVDMYNTQTIQGEQCSAVTARCVRLDLGEEVDVAWEAISGDNGDPLLPTECAVRLSLTAIGGARGGPFLAGFTTTSVDEDGGLTSGYRGLVVAAVENFKTAVLASDWTLGLHRPTTTEVAEVLTCRVGRIFDVIRRRRNDLPEGYVTTVFAQVPPFHVGKPRWNLVLGGDYGRTPGSHVISWDLATILEPDVHSGSLVTAPTPGLYICGAVIATTSTAKLLGPQVTIQVSTGAQLIGKGWEVANAGSWMADGLVELEVGDTLEVSATLSTGTGTKNLDSSICRFWGCKVGPKRWT